MSESFHIALTRMVTTIGKPLGVTADVTVDASTDGYRIRARMPLIYAVAVVNDSDDLSTKNLPDLLVKTVEDLQREAFASAWKHIEHHDRTGEVESLKRITLGALKLAEKYVEKGSEEDLQIASFRQYVERVRR